MIINKNSFVAFSLLFVWMSLSSASQASCSCNNLSELKSLADENNLEALYCLGKCLIYSDNKEDKEQAYNYFKNAADNGHAKSQVAIGHCYYNGLGTQDNEEKAGEYYKKAADQKNIWGLFFLAKYYQETLLDNGEAINIYETLANKNHISSIIELIKCYYEDPDNKKLKFYWIQRATELGYSYDPGGRIGQFI